jgi:hypothetical protein
MSLFWAVVLFYAEFSHGNNFHVERNKGESGIELTLSLNLACVLFRKRLCKSVAGSLESSMTTKKTTTR